MAQKPALGKGLASLLPGAGMTLSPSIVVPQEVVVPSSEVHVEDVAVAVPVPGLKHPAGATSAGPALPVIQPDDGNRDRHPGVSLVTIDDIKANPFQPRREFEDSAIEELAKSIQANGLIQPIVVRKTAEGYELIAGERRLRACKRLGLKQIPIIIKRVTDKESLEMALIENIQRQDLNCVETALAYFQLIEEFGLTQEEVARRVGKDRTSVSNHLRLLRLPEQVVEELKKGLLTFGHGRALLSLETQEDQMKMRGQVIERSLSVRDTEALIDQWKKEKANAKPAGPGFVQGQPGIEGSVSSLQPGAADVQSRLKAISKELTQKLSARVNVKGSDVRGKIVVEYRSREDLERILERLHN